MTNIENKLFLVNITFYDGSELKGVKLYKESYMYDSLIYEKPEVRKLLNGWSTIYFGNDAIQGWFIPQHVEGWELVYIADEDLEEVFGWELLKELNNK